MCFNPYHYDQFTRDAASRTQGVQAPEMQRPGDGFAGVWARVWCFLDTLRPARKTFRTVK